MGRRLGHPRPPGKRLNRVHLAVVLADGNVSITEVQCVLKDGNEVDRVLSNLHSQRDQALLDTATARHLKAPA